MDEKKCPRCKMLSEGLIEAIRTIKHCRRTLDVVVANKNNPKIIVQSALDTEVYIKLTMKRLLEIEI